MGVDIKIMLVEMFFHYTFYIIRATSVVANKISASGKGGKEQKVTGWKEGYCCYLGLVRDVVMLKMSKCNPSLDRIFQKT